MWTKSKHFERDSIDLQVFLGFPGCHPTGISTISCWIVLHFFTYPAIHGSYGKLVHITRLHSWKLMPIEPKNHPNWKEKNTSPNHPRLKKSQLFQAHSIHVTGTFTYICLNFMVNIPSREQHIPPLEKEHHLQKPFGKGHVSFQESLLLLIHGWYGRVYFHSKKNTTWMWPNQPPVIAMDKQSSSGTIYRSDPWKKLVPCHGTQSYQENTNKKQVQQ